MDMATFPLDHYYFKDYSQRGTETWGQGLTGRCLTYGPWSKWELISLTQPAPTRTASIGLALQKLDRARENWKIFREGGPLTEYDKERIEAIRKEFDHVFCRRCDYCQPCTEKISIQFLIGLKSTIKRFGNQVQELKWMKEMIARARNCSECGECTSRCPYQLPIPDLIKKNLAWYDSLTNQ